MAIPQELWDRAEEISWAEGRPFEDRDGVQQNPEKVQVGFIEESIRTWVASLGLEFEI